MWTPPVTGDLAAHAGAKFTEPNDYPVANSIGVGNVDIEKMCEFLKSKNSLTQFARGRRSGKDDQIVRFGRRVGVVLGRIQRRGQADSACR